VNPQVFCCGVTMRYCSGLRSTGVMKRLEVGEGGDFLLREEEEWVGV